jgi:hypothetical protein
MRSCNISSKTYSTSLKFEAVASFENVVGIHQTVRKHIAECRNLNLKKHFWASLNFHQYFENRKTYGWSMWTWYGFHFPLQYFSKYVTFLWIFSETRVAHPRCKQVSLQSTSKYCPILPKLESLSEIPSRKCYEKLINVFKDFYIGHIDEMSPCCILIKKPPVAQLLGNSQNTHSVVSSKVREACRI